jgi:predicted RNA-binding protein YlqC (UPF0109 family)
MKNGIEQFVNKIWDTHQNRQIVIIIKSELAGRILGRGGHRLEAVKQKIRRITREEIDFNMKKNKCPVTQESLLFIDGSKLAQNLAVYYLVSLLIGDQGAVEELEQQSAKANFRTNSLLKKRSFSKVPLNQFTCEKKNGTLFKCTKKKNYETSINPTRPFPTFNSTNI